MREIKSIRVVFVASLSAVLAACTHEAPQSSYPKADIAAETPTSPVPKGFCKDLDADACAAKIWAKLEADNPSNPSRADETYVMPEDPVECRAVCEGHFQQSTTACKEAISEKQFRDICFSTITNEREDCVLKCGS